MSTVHVSPASMETSQARFGYDAKSNRLPLVLLPSRLILFAVFQVAIAALIWAVHGSFSLDGAAIYWPFAALGANCVTVVLLRAALAREGRSLGELYRFTAGSVGRDILITLGVFVVAAPVAMFPNMFLARALFGSAEAVTPLMFGRMPLALAVLTVLFPLTIAFAELPLYLGYLSPRLTALTGSRAAAVLIASAMLALQHCTLPLVLDARFILWRFGMFLPLALLLAGAYTWRPRLLPYLMIGHALLDLTTVAMIVRASM